MLNRGELLVGQPVEQGAVLASVYNPELQPALASAQARLNELRSQSEQATREAERAETLYQRGVISAQQREQLESTAASLRAALQNAQAGVRQRQQLTAEAELRAPFAGHIEALPVESGEFVAPGQTVVRLASGQALEMTIQIPAEWAGGLTNGQAVFRVRDGRAEQLPVQVSAMRGEWAMLVTDDLQADDQVVYAGLSRLLDGDRVEVRP